MKAMFEGRPAPEKKAAAPVEQKKKPAEVQQEKQDRPATAGKGKRANKGRGGHQQEEQKQQPKQQKEKPAPAKPKTTEDEKEYKAAAQEIKKIQEEQKAIDPNDFAAVKGNAAKLQEKQDQYKKAKKNAKRQGKGGNWDFEAESKFEHLNVEKHSNYLQFKKWRPIKDIFNF